MDEQEAENSEDQGTGSVKSKAFLATYGSLQAEYLGRSAIHVDHLRRLGMRRILPHGL